MGTGRLVDVVDLHRRFGAIEAVRGLTFSLEQGDVIGFLGPNGAGKSTTMRMLAGVLAPDAGNIRIGGHDLQATPLAAKSLIGYLPEQPPLLYDHTVDEFLHYCADIRRVTKPRDAVQSAKSRCGLEKVGHRLLGNLSKGYQQRAGIAQAVLHRPRLVILDEPTAGLDPIQIQEIRELVRALGAEHGVILSTHILPEVQTVSDRVLIIHEGRLVLDARLTELDDGGSAPSLRVRLGRPPDAATLASIEGVIRVESAGDGRWRLEHHPTPGFAERFAQRAVESGWALAELAPETPTLEEIFVKLTFGDSGQHPSPEGTG